MTSHHNEPAWINNPEYIFWIVIQNSILSAKTKSVSQGTCFFRDPKNYKKVNALLSQDRVFFE
jgi:hypothetical protein